MCLSAIVTSERDEGGRSGPRRTQKSLLYRGQDGRPFSWPYTVSGDIWKYLQDHRQAFFPEEEKSNSELLEAFKKLRRDMLHNLRFNR